MTIDNMPDKINDMVEPGTKSANRFCFGSLIVLFIVALLSIFIDGFFPSIEYPKELVQALLICSTALMGLTGLMIIETKKTKISDLPATGWQRIREINKINSLARALVFLRWSFPLSIISIILSVFWLMNSSSLVMVLSIIAFFGQLYLLLFALIFTEFFPP